MAERTERSVTIQGEVETMLVIQVRVPDTGHSPGGVRSYTIAEVVKMAYRWGRQDERDDANDRTRAGVGNGWTVGGFSLDALRHDGDHEPARRD